MDGEQVARESVLSVQEASRLRRDLDAVEMEGSASGYDDSDQRSQLAAMREMIGDDAYPAAIAKVDEVRAEHGERARVVADVPPAVDWEAWSVQDIDTALRALWDHVALGPDLPPVEAVWNVPEWRAEDER